MNKKYVVYETTNSENPKIYVGVHKMNKDKDFDGYLGSGKVLRVAIDKYGEDKFTFNILEEFDLKQDAYDLEKFIVNDEFVNRVDTYNVSKGGLGGTFEIINKDPEIRKRWWENRKIKAKELEVHPMAAALTKESKTKAIETRRKNVEAEGLTYNHWMNTPEIRRKNYEIQKSNAKSRGGFRGDHMQKPEIRSKANKSISKSLSRVTKEYSIQGQLLGEYIGIRSSINPPKLPVPMWTAIYNIDPFRIWVRPSSTFETSFRDKLKSDTVIEFKDGKIISISSPKLRDMGRSYSGNSLKDYRSLKTDSEFITYEEYSKRSTTRSRDRTSKWMEMESSLEDDDIV